MNLFQFDIDNKTLIIFITSLIWAINFRCTFKNIDSHMDTGSYASLKFEHTLILSKNILCIFFFIGYYYEKKLNKLKSRNEKQIVETHRGSMVIFQFQEKRTKKNSLLNSIFFLHQLRDSREKIFFSLKIFFIIVITYFTEEIYFIVANNHILDRVICHIRNLGVLISLSIFSPLLIKNSLVKYSHQFVPLIIIFILSVFIITFNIIKVYRFDKIYGLNSIVYLISFILMGLETTLLKYLVDSQFVSIFLILGVKGIIGTIVFSILIFFYRKRDFFNFFDNFLYFEFDDMYETFEYFQKLIYIISLIFLQYLKIYIINRFSANHLLPTLMIADLIYFPLYCIERFVLQVFEISNIYIFCFNTFLGILNLFLMLIFNEILECKFWGLNTNLKKNINKRQIEDIMISLAEIKTISAENENDINIKNNGSDDEATANEITNQEQEQQT